MTHEVTVLIDRKTSRPASPTLQIVGRCDATVPYFYDEKLWIHNPTTKFSRITGTVNLFKKLADHTNRQYRLKSQTSRRTAGTSRRTVG